MRKAVCLWVGSLTMALSATCAASGDGLQLRADGLAWDGLQGRLMFGMAASSRADLNGIDTDHTRINSLSLMGDYYLGHSWLGTAGGLRATSGLLMGARGSLWSSPVAMDRRSALANSSDSSSDAGTTPYFGVGYTSLSGKSGWGLSADLGLMALNPRSAVRLGSQTLDDTLRDMRLLPLLQLGVSYSF